MGLPKIPRLKLVDRVDWLLELCRAKRVLHIGCVDFNPLHVSAARERLSANLNLHVALSRVCERLVGVDIDKEGLALLKEKYLFEDLYVMDAESMDLSLIGISFDVVVAGELIEHLNNPGRFFSALMKAMTPETLLILTTPNVHAMKFSLYSLFGRERVNEDHRFFFSFSTLSRMLYVHSFTPVPWYTALEKTGGFRNSLANMVLYPFFKAFPRYADTMICVAKLNHQ